MRKKSFGRRRVLFLSAVLFLMIFLLNVVGPTVVGAEGIKVLPSEKAIYSLGQWSDVDRGSHRAVIEVPEGIDGAVRVYVPWRRRDFDVDGKRLILIDAQTDQIVENGISARMDRESLDYVFNPTTRPGKFYLYYLPHSIEPGSGYYGGDYLAPLETNADETLAACGLPSDAISSGAWRNLPEAKLLRLEARGSFESFYPMEVVAKASERTALIEKFAKRDFLLFPEDRTRPIVMTDDLPLIWIERGPSDSFTGEALRDEYYAFQIGLFASRGDVRDVKAEWSDLQSENGDVIPADKITCFNLGGINSHGEPFTKRVDVPAGKTQAFWFGVDVGEETAPATYSGTVAVSGEDFSRQIVRVTLKVGNDVITDRGDNEIWRHSRLRWLNSTLGIDDNVFAPFTPMTIDGKRVGCVGRAITFGNDGLPTQIDCGENSLLASPVRFTVTPAGGEATVARGQKSDYGKISPGSVALSASGNFGDQIPLKFQTETKAEFDGHLHFDVTLTADEAVDLADVTLEIPFAAEKVPYLMGLGQPGGKRPETADWKWGGPVYNDSFWLGDVYGGLQCELRGASYCGPMVNLYWPIGQLQPPATWWNDDRGGCSLRTTRIDPATSSNQTSSSVVTTTATSGARRLEKGESITFEFAFLITPVKPLDTVKQFTSRYYHSNAPIEDVKKAGGNIVNIHHANALNLYINYPFLTVDRLSRHVQAAHDAGIKVKIYYTVRELTNHLVEWAAIRSLGTEILADGKGGGYPWLREHFGNHYTPAWYDRLETSQVTEKSAGESGSGDNSGAEVSAAVVTSGDSRWLNYYIEGLRWLLTHLEIDGLYLDDVTYDRNILKRMRSVMESCRSGCQIDLHSNTAFSRGPANQYLEFFPYVDKLWFGESFDYEKSAPDYWLTEISGIPYGVMGEMLQNGGNPWRGMVYGMTARLPWSGPVTRYVGQTWKVWDDFGIADAKMIGYWEKDAPVRTDAENVLVTSYVRDGRTLLAVASWNPKPVECRLEVDWNALGLDPDKVTVTAPEMRVECAEKDGSKTLDGYQPGRTFRVDEPIPVEPGKGWLLILSEKE